MCCINQFCAPGVYTTGLKQDLLTAAQESEAAAKASYLWPAWFLSVYMRVSTIQEDLVSVFLFVSIPSTG